MREEGFWAPVFRLILVVQFAIEGQMGDRPKQGEGAGGLGVRCAGRQRLLAALLPAASHAASPLAIQPALCLAWFSCLP